MWGSDIGEAASTLTGFDEWRLTTGVGPDSVRAPPASTKTPRRRKKSEKAIEKKVQEWIKGTGKPTIRSFVALPTNELRKTWRADIDSALLAQHANDQETQQRARECMQKVHKATQQLRACYTEMAMEKASIQVTIALLELASQPACYDPFVCLQQAAMYASQAPKAGNSDMAFRHSLPEMEKCTPIEALNALGRADCLHSVYFPNEAAFLCSYVAKVCRLYRDREQPDYEWNGQWKVVAIYAFNVSVMIRTTVSTVLDKTMQKSFLSMWERDVVEELERGRSDGMLWKRSLYQSGLESDLEEGEGVEEEGGHEEEELGGNVDDGTDVEDENGVEEEEQYEGEEEERHAQHVHSHDSSQNNPLFSEYNIHDYGAGFAHSMSSEIAHDPGKSDEDSITGIDMVPV